MSKCPECGHPWSEHSPHPADRYCRGADSEEVCWCDQIRCQHPQCDKPGWLTGRGKALCSDHLRRVAV